MALRRNLASLFFLLLWTDKTVSQQQGWLQQSSFPLDNMTALSAKSADNLFIVGQKQTIAQSMNGGVTWIKRHFQISEHLNDVRFADSNTGWIVGAEGSIYKTTDGGTSWLYQNSGSTNTFTSIAALDINTAWTTGNDGKLFKTTDGGSLWTQVLSQLNLGSLEDFRFANATLGLAVGRASMYRTTDGGLNWTGISPLVTYGTPWIKKVHFVDNSRAWGVGITADRITTSCDAFGSCYTSILNPRSTIWKSTDGGVTWSWTVFSSAAYLYGTFFTDNNTGWAVGDGGTILKTTNGGTTWSAQTSNSTARLRSLHFFDSQRGIVVGASGTIRRTTDGGTTWQSVASGSNSNLNSIVFPTTQIGIAVGDSGTVLKTTDAGATWQSLSGGRAVTLQSVSFVGAFKAWAAGSDGTILKSTDGGVSWNKKSSGSTASLSSVFFADEQTGWALGTEILLKTTDGGESWTSRSLAAGGYYKAFFFADVNTGWMVGGTGTYYPVSINKTTDGGITWTAQTIPTSRPLNALYFLDASTGFVVGDSGTVLKTTNGGSSWTLQVSGTEGHLNSIYFTSAATGWSAGQSGTILKTSDGGSTWGRQWTGTTNYTYLNSIRFANESVGWAIGYRTIMKTTDGGGTVMFTPTLVSPNNNAVGVATNVVLRWTKSLGATSYKLQISRSKSFSTNIVNQDGITDTSYAPTNLASTSTYYWRVSAEYAAGTSFWSKAHSFETVGIVWRQQMSGGTAWLNSVHFVNASIGWAASSGGEIFKTTNGGKSWAMLSTDGTTRYESIFFVDSLKGWSVGNGGSYPNYIGAINKTTDGGTTWTAQPSGTSNTLTSVRFVDDLTGWAVGNQGTILKTTNGGSSWSAQSAGTTGRLSCISVLNASTAWIAGDYIFKTTNGGTTWTTQSSVSFPRSVHFINSSRGGTVGSYGVYITTNGGTSWAYINPGTSERLNAVQFVDSLRVWIVGEKGALLYSADGGNLWQQRTSGTSAYLNALHFVNDSTGWVVGSSGTILKSATRPGVGNASPLLISPADRSTEVSLSPTLQWSAVEGATSYRVQAAWYSASFNSPRIDTSDLTLLSFTPKQLADGTPYYWRVSAYDADGPGNWSNAWSFTTRAGPPAPSLYVPANGATAVSASPLLQWTQSVGASSYQVQLSDISTFATPSLDKSVADTFYLATNLFSTTTYYWRVRAGNWRGTSEWSSTWNFTTKVIGPPVPILVSPSNAATGIPANATFRWIASRGAASYQFQLSSDSTFAASVLDQTVADTAFSATGLSPNTTYFWRVNARDTSGTSRWSSVWTFATITVGPPAPSLAYPPNNATNTASSLTMSWNSSQGATSYRLQLAVISSFSPTLINQSLTDTSYAITGLLTGTDYYWRVNATDATGTGRWSQVWRFTTTQTGGGWAQASGVSSIMNAVRFVDSENGWIVGYGGSIFKTSDGGSTWSKKTSGTNATLRSVCFANVSTGWVAGSSGTILKSSDGGGTWIAQTTGTTSNLYSIHFSSASEGWAVGDGGRILRTTDGGATWISQSSGGTDWLQSVFALDTQTGVIAGPNMILKTTNSGANWIKQALPTYAYLLSTFFIDASTGWAVGADGILLKTTNTGSTWFVLPTGTNNWLTSIHFIDSQRGWAAGWKGTIIRTTDGGASWGRQISGTSLSLYGVHFVNASSGWVVGFSNLGTVDGGGTTLFPPMLLTPSDVSMGVSTRPALRWNATTGIVSYQLQVSTSSSFYTRVVNDSALSVTSRQVGPLNPNQTYYWRVIGYTLAGLDLYSPAWRFTTGTSATAVELLEGIPSEFCLYQNYPNPFNPATTIHFDVPRTCEVEIRVYSTLGMEVARLVDARFTTGRYSVQWNATGFTSGVYFYQIRAADFTQTKKLLLVK